MVKEGHWQIFVPGVNEYPHERSEKWAHKSLTCARAKVDKKRVPDVKARLPLKTAHYAIEMTFGKWRLMGPHGDEAKSPMDMVLDLLEPVIKKDGWKEFKKQFKKKLLQQFEIIAWFKYATERIDKVNVRINQLISEFVNQDVSVSLNFIPHPNTGESFYSERLVNLRSKIMEHFTGQALDTSKSKPPIEPNSPVQMDMHLDLEVTKKK